MSITLREFTGPSLNLPPMPPAAPPQAPQMSAELLSRIHTIVQNASTDSIERSQKYIDAVMRDTLKTMEERLSTIEAPKPQVMAIDVSGVVSTLSAPLNPKQAEIVGDIILNAKLGQNIMLVGPAGCGKTTLAQKAAEAMGLPFYCNSFTAGASESWILGRHTPTGFFPSAFCIAFDSKGLGGVYLADEFDAADSNLAMLFNAAIENGFFINPMTGERLERHPNFVFIAACNTYGKGANHIYTARNRLDAATLRRFARLEVTYDLDLEKQLCPDRNLLDMLWSARMKLTELGSDEILSSGCIKRAALQLGAGWSLAKVIASLTAGWSPELIKQVGLDKAEPKKRVSKSASKAIEPSAVLAAEEPMAF